MMPACPTATRGAERAKTRRISQPRHAMLARSAIALRNMVTLAVAGRHGPIAPLYAVALPGCSSVVEGFTSAQQAFICGTGTCRPSCVPGRPASDCPRAHADAAGVPGGRGHAAVHQGAHSRWRRDAACSGWRHWHWRRTQAATSASCAQHASASADRPSMSSLTAQCTRARAVATLAQPRPLPLSQHRLHELLTDFARSRAQRQRDMHAQERR